MWETIFIFFVQLRFVVSLVVGLVSWGGTKISHCNVVGFRGDMVVLLWGIVHLVFEENKVR